MRLIFRHLRLLPNHTWDTRDVLGHTRGLFGRAGVVSLALVAAVAALAIGMIVYVASQGWPLGHQMSVSPGTDHVLGLDSNKASSGPSAPARGDKSRRDAGRHSGAQHHASRTATAPAPGGQPAAKPDRGSGGGGGAPNRTGQQATNNPGPGAKAGSTGQTAASTPAVVAPEGNGKGHAYGHSKAKGGGGDVKSGGSAKGAVGATTGSEKKSIPPGQAKKSGS
jgi:hypothetical protein